MRASRSDAAVYHSKKKSMLYNMLFYSCFISSILYICINYIILFITKIGEF